MTEIKMTENVNYDKELTLLSSTDFSICKFVEFTSISCDIEIFKLFLSYIKYEKINECFIATDKEEYTLLTFFCYIGSKFKDLDSPLLFFEEKLKLIIDHGGDPKQVVGIGKKTGLSYLVKQNSIYLVKVYIKLGGDYRLGYLLVNCILGKHDYSMFDYLSSLRLDPNEIEPCTGMNALIAICSLENPEILLDKLIKNYVGLFEIDTDTKTHDNKAVDFINPINRYKLITRLDIYMHTKKCEFDELMHKVHENTIDNRFTDIYLLGSKKVVGEFIGTTFLEL